MSSRFLRVYYCHWVQIVAGWGNRFSRPPRPRCFRRNISETSSFWPLFDCFCRDLIICDFQALRAPVFRIFIDFLCILDLDFSVTRNFGYFWSEDFRWVSLDTYFGNWLFQPILWAAETSTKLHAVHLGRFCIIMFNWYCNACSLYQPWRNYQLDQVFADRRCSNWLNYDQRHFFSLLPLVAWQNTTIVISACVNQKQSDQKSTWHFAWA